MQRVQSSRAQSSYVLLSEPNAALEGHFRHVHLKPEARFTVPLELRVQFLRLAGRNLAQEQVLGNGVRPFRAMKRRQPNPGMLCQQMLRLGKVPIVQVKRNEEARIRVDAQYRARLRSLIKRSAPGKILSPKIFLARAAKSGHSAGGPSPFAGMICPMTRSRARNSTVFPCCNQAFRRRVSRSWRIFMDGIGANVPQNVAHSQVSL